MTPDNTPNQNGFNLEGLWQRMLDFYDILNDKIDNYFKEFRKESAKLKANDKQLENAMGHGKRVLDNEINNLNQLLTIAQRDINFLKKENSILKGKIEELEKKLDILLSEKVKQYTLAHREANGGAIGSIQHQDLFSSFISLKQTANSLAQEIVNFNKLSTKQEIRAKVSKIFTERIDYDTWFKSFQEHEGNKISDEVSINMDNLSHFKSFYEKVNELKNNMQESKSSASFYLPNVGDNYDNKMHVLISEKCDDKKPISIIIFPGFYRGTQLDEKATVYTAISIIR